MKNCTGIMIQGTSSDAGKSFITTALCRIFSDMGYAVCPFKSQNMSNNSCVTPDGLEMGRAQGVQAEAARVEPRTYMNPILLKPRKDTSSEIVLMGKVFDAPCDKNYYRTFTMGKGLETLREALALTADLGWIDRQGVSKNVYNRVQACEYLQRRIARTLLEKLGTLDLAASKADDPYTADLMAKDLVAWFEERLRSREPLTDHVRNLQQSLLKSTVAAANVKDKPSSGSGSAFALFDGSGSLSDGGDLFPATDAGALPDMPAERRADDFTPLGAGEVQGAAYGYRTPRVIPAFREHLFYGLLLDMKAMYRRGAASAPLADTRSFCRYMADRIDRELAVE